LIRESGELRETPLNGRNYLDLIRNASEATRGQEGGEVEGFGPYSPGRNSSLNSVGQRGQSNNFRLNGMDNNEIWLRGAIFEPPLEAIEEVSLLSVYMCLPPLGTRPEPLSTFRPGLALAAFTEARSTTNKPPH
jgi:hypothetical protein